MRKSYVQINGVLYEKGTEPNVESHRGPAIIPDAPDFVSPIDGKVVRGRAGIRDHCARHNVVPTLELQGLPAQRPTYTPDRAAIRETIKETMIRKGYWRA